MKKLLGIVVLVFLTFNNANANIKELNAKLIELEKKIDKCLESKDNNFCDDLNLYTTFLIEIMGNEEYAKHIDSDRCEIGTKCGAAISRISGKYLQIMELNLNKIEEIIEEEKNQEKSKFTLTDEDSLKAQISSCWSLPLGLPYDKDLIVRIKLKLRSNGTVLSSEILDKEKMKDGYYKVLAESTLRAIKLCEPLRVPSSGYENWKELVLTFNPKEFL